jgi:hypothetical protein
MGSQPCIFLYRYLLDLHDLKLRLLLFITGRRSKDFASLGLRSLADFYFRHESLDCEHKKNKIIWRGANPRVGSRGT